MEDQLYKEFYEVETRHWWFVARQKIVHHIIRENLHLAQGSRILDVGCGTGAFLLSLADRFDAYGTDTSPLAIDFCKQRGLHNVYRCTLETFPNQDMRFDLVLFLDVIEHVDDDLGIVRDATRFLKPGGSMLVTVPAYQFLWSRHDDVNFHKRRYVKRSLKSVFENSGLQIQLLSYFNTILFPAALAGRLAQKVFPQASDQTLSIPSKFANSMLTRTFAFEQNIIGRIPLPFGLSLVCLATKPDRPV